MSKHKIEILKKGEGMTEESKPVCSCGWIGKGYEAYCSWQWTFINEQIEKHLDNTKNET